jgi:hypothetical protein
VSETWYIVQVEDSFESTVIGPGVRIRFAISGSGRIISELRDVDDVAASAAEKGFDVSFANTFYSISSQRLAEIRKLIRNKLFSEYGSFPVHAVQIEPVLRLTK